MPASEGLLSAGRPSGDGEMRTALLELRLQRGNRIKEIKPRLRREAAPVGGRVLCVGGACPLPPARLPPALIPGVSALLSAGPRHGRGRGLWSWATGLGNPQFQRQVPPLALLRCWASERTHLFTWLGAPGASVHLPEILEEEVSHLGVPWEKAQGRGRWRAVIAGELGRGAGRRLAAWGRVCPSAR